MYQSDGAVPVDADRSTTPPEADDRSNLTTLRTMLTRPGAVVDDVETHDVATPVNVNPMLSATRQFAALDPSDMPVAAVAVPVAAIVNEHVFTAHDDALTVMSAVVVVLPDCGHLIMQFSMLHPDAENSSVESVAVQVSVGRRVEYPSPMNLMPTGIVIAPVFTVDPLNVFEAVMFSACSARI